MAMQSRLTSAFLLFFLLLLYAAKVSAQNKDLAKLWETSISGIDKIATNNKGDIFIADKQGYLFQYHPEGKAVNQLATSLSAPVTHLDAFNTVNIFLFSAALQRFVLIDRFLNPISTIAINEINVSGWVSQASPGNNNSLWVFDEADLNLKKFSLTNNELVQSQPLNNLIQQNELKVVMLTERYNLLFLQIAEEGLYIFDNQANFIEKIPLSTQNKSVIDGDFIYVIQEDKLLKINYLSKLSTSFTIPQEKNFDKLGLSSQQILLANEKELAVFERPKDL